jgi:hypothetical protein
MLADWDMIAQKFSAIREFVQCAHTRLVTSLLIVQPDTPLQVEYLDLDAAPQQAAGL